ncbi:hypothetical protein AB0K09_16965 [Streptomyces sp. NPDC049577]|uniref:hypothetical protein n=1 Tax=Streptomyces sp. NPDC049577 TaxID=3155153 RepID=UPI00341DB78D
MSGNDVGAWKGDAAKFEEHLELTAEENRRVTSVWQRAETARGRLDGVMHDIQRGTAESHGSKLEGLEYSLKGLDSLRRKVAVAKDDGDSVEKTVSKVNDLNRYTLTFESETYTEGVKETYAQLREQGYEPVPGSEKNTWQDPVYKGVNTTWRNSATDEKFELQFHTPESFKAKSENHGLYEISRSGKVEKLGNGNPALTKKYQEALDYLQSERYQGVRIPPGVEELREPKVRAKINPNVDPEAVEQIRQMEAELHASQEAEPAKKQSAAAVSTDLGESLQAEGPDLRNRLATKSEAPKQVNTPAPAVDPLPAQSRGRGPSLK